MYDWLAIQKTTTSKLNTFHRPILMHNRWNWLKKITNYLTSKPSPFFKALKVAGSISC